MFPASYQTVGYIPPGTQTADPANDPNSSSETEIHYWFQFDTGSGMPDADPLIAGARSARRFTTSPRHVRRGPRQPPREDRDQARRRDLQPARRPVRLAA